MKSTDDFRRIEVSKLSRRLITVAILGTVLSLGGCATLQESLRGLGEKKADEFTHAKALLTEGNYEAAFKENQKLLAEGKGAPDVALFNMGLISASLNPKKDYPRALTSFKTLVNQYPGSTFAEQARVWIQVLEERQKLAEEKQKLLEEKRAATREREALSQEREKLKYSVEKSRQLDMQIEQRRRQTQSR